MMLALLWGWQAGIVTIGQMTTVMGQTFFMVGAAWMFGWGVIMLADELGYIDDSIRTLMVEIDVQDAPESKPLAVSKGAIPACQPQSSASIMPPPSSTKDKRL